jgi:hypothetical protein
MKDYYLVINNVVKYICSLETCEYCEAKKQMFKQYIERVS